MIRHKFRKKKKNKLLSILLLTITMGFAILTATLQINGLITLKGNIWDIHWDSSSITLNNGVIATATSTATGPEVSTVTTTDDTVTFAVNLQLPGDFFEFTIDAVNAGTIDGYVNNVIKYIYDKDDYDESGDEATPINPENIIFTVVYDDNGQVPANGDVLLKREDSYTPTRRTYKIRVEFDENATEVDEEDATYICLFKVTYIQPRATTPETPDIDEPAHSDGEITILSGTVGDLQPGDVIGIGDTEDFYVISSDNSTNGKTVLLAKNNLLVGVNTELDSKFMTSENTQGYGLQSVDAVGYNQTTEEYVGAVAFSATNYWVSGSYNNYELISPYNKNNTIYYDNENETFKYTISDAVTFTAVYNPSYSTQPNFANTWQWFNVEGYSIAYYVNEYVNRLKTMGAPSTITGRLLTYEEADGAQNIEDNGTSIILNGNYWFGDAESATYITTGDRSSLSYEQYSDFYYNCVRPVIEVPTSSIG